MASNYEFKFKHENFIGNLLQTGKETFISRAKKTLEFSSQFVCEEGLFGGKIYCDTTL